MKKWILIQLYSYVFSTYVLLENKAVLDTIQITERAISWHSPIHNFYQEMVTRIFLDSSYLLPAW